MRPTEFIEMFLKNCRYRGGCDILTPEANAAAIMNGLVIGHCVSDDLCILEGAVYEEFGAYNGTNIYINGDGQVSEKPFEYKNCRHIQVVWKDKSAPNWYFKTTIPHKTFDILEDGYPFCKGIVFCLDDIQTVKRCEFCSGDEFGGDYCPICGRVIERKC